MFISQPGVASKEKNKIQEYSEHHNHTYTLKRSNNSRKRHATPTYSLCPPSQLERPAYTHTCLTHNNNNIRPRTPKSMPPTSDKHVPKLVLYILVYYSISTISSSKRHSGITSHASHGCKTGTRSMQPVRLVPLGVPVVR